MSSIRIARFSAWIDRKLTPLTITFGLLGTYHFAQRLHSHWTGAGAPAHYLGLILLFGYPLPSFYLLLKKQPDPVRMVFVMYVLLELGIAIGSHF